MTLQAFDWIAKHAAAQPEAPAMCDLRSGRRYSYAQMHERLDRCAQFLHERCGVGQGDRVALLMPVATAQLTALN